MIMKYEVRLHPSVVKYLRELDRKTADRIKMALYQLQLNPFRGRPGADIKRLKGTKGRQDFFRLRVGNYRVVYTTEGNMILVTDIFRRERGYRL
jgi:mRNA interferase RelE/StbE